MRVLINLVCLLRHGEEGLVNENIFLGRTLKVRVAAELLGQKFPLLRRNISVFLVQLVPDQNDVVLGHLGTLVPEVVDYFREAGGGFLSTQIEDEDCPLTVAKVRLNQGEKRLLPTSVPDLQAHSIFFVDHHSQTLHVHADRSHLISKLRVDKSHQKRRLTATSLP